jgi:glyoxylase-like metal-dependent hydrolase (beta-lactamase superfamily II)
MRTGPILALALAAFTVVLHAATLPREVKFTSPGGNAVNSVRVRSVAIYADVAGSPKAPAYVLLTHARREIASAAEPAIARGAQAIVPAAERQQFEAPAGLWEAFERARFHDYAQQSTKFPVRPIPVSRAVHSGDVIEAGGLRYEVLDTPGFTRGSVSYLVSIDNTRIAFTGDLVLAGGKLLDLYSLQDAIPEANLRGYHGYAARSAALIRSLRAILAANPDIVVPARGAVITDPRATIEQLISRLQAVMANHFSTDALLWYFGAANLRTRSAPVLDGRAVDSMPMAEKRPLPPWIVEIGNSRLILSSTGAAFLVDGGYPDIVKSLDKLQSQGRFKQLEGIWVTHYHDDHTDHVQEVANKFGAPVHTTALMADILAYPARYRMPCLTTASIRAQVEAPGSSLQWHEFQLTFFDFPGQTMYHGGLHLRRDSGDQIFFVGDSFTPSGLDDYCLYNRNILREGEGYLHCLDILQRFPEAWLINEHVSPMFHYSGSQYDRMRAGLSQRMRLLDELSPWPDHNFLLDEEWARIYPYGQEVAAGEFALAMHITNHAADTREFQVIWNPPAGVELVSADRSVRVEPHRDGSASARFRCQAPGLYMVTAGLTFGDYSLADWAEAMVRVK